jgi:hypothetical protein
MDKMIAYKKNSLVRSSSNYIFMETSVCLSHSLTLMTRKMLRTFFKVAKDNFKMQTDAFYSDCSVKFFALTPTHLPWATLCQSRP